jgi:hypothetical protein
MINIPNELIHKEYEDHNWHSVLFEEKMVILDKMTTVLTLKFKQKNCTVMD